MVGTEGVGVAGGSVGVDPAAGELAGCVDPHAEKEKSRKKSRQPGKSRQENLLHLGDRGVNVWRISVPFLKNKALTAVLCSQRTMRGSASHAPKDVFLLSVQLLGDDLQFSPLQNG